MSKHGWRKLSRSGQRKIERVVAKGWKPTTARVREFERERERIQVTQQQTEGK